MTKIKQKKLSERTRELAMRAVNGKARFGRWFTVTSLSGMKTSDKVRCPLGQLFDGNVTIIRKTTPKYWFYEFSISTRSPPNNCYTFPLLALADEFEAAGL